MKCSIVIPVYNSAGTLELLIQRLDRVLQELASEYEVIFVNDDSRDNSWQVITRLSERYPWIRGINLMKNFGQHNALLTGILVAQYEVIVTMDDDLQHPPEEIHKLTSELRNGFDVVYGIPEAQAHGFFRSLTSRFTKFVMGKALDLPNLALSGAFRVFRIEVRNAFKNYHSQFVSIDALLSWGTSRFGYVVVHHAPRFIGKSNYTFRKLIRHTVNMLTGFSTLPLRLASLLGFTFTGFGFLVLVYVIGRYIIEGSPVQGFPFLASIVSLFSGVQLFVTGIFGEYLARIYFNMMGRPLGVERETVGFPNNQEKNAH
jgi:glycosyltransferase involved in cell wall biosynthesis